MSQRVSDFDGYFMSWAGHLTMNGGKERRVLNFSLEASNDMGTTLTNQNDIHNETKSRLNSGMLAIIQYKIFCLPVSYQKT
jgi:hypothetical protein